MASAAYADTYGEARRRYSPSRGPYVDTVSIIGQSNANGEALLTDLSAALAAALTTCPAWYKITGTKIVTTTTQDYLRTAAGAPFNGRHGCEVQLMRTLADKGYNGLLQVGRGGASLYNDGTPGNHWAPSVAGSWCEQWLTEAATMVTQFAARMFGAVVRHRGAFWLQGEEDAKYSAVEKPVEDPSGNYAANLTALIARSRAVFGADYWWVLQGLCPSITGRPYIAEVNAAMQEVADADALVWYRTGTARALQGDNVHDTSASQVAMGLGLGTVPPRLGVVDGVAVAAGSPTRVAARSSGATISAGRSVGAITAKES